MGISLKTHKLLWGKSGKMCAFPGCRRELVEEATLSDDPSIIGEEAHIVGREQIGPRGNSQLTKEERDKEPNLILLCSIHHKIIDDQVNKYTVEVLKKMKFEHEKWVEKNLTNEKEFKIIDEPEIDILEQFKNISDKSELKKKIYRILNDPDTPGIIYAHNLFELLKTEFINKWKILKSKTKDELKEKDLGNQYIFIYNQYQINISWWYYCNNALYGSHLDIVIKERSNPKYRYGEDEEYFDLDRETYNFVIDLNFNHGWKNESLNDSFYTNEELIKFWLRKLSQKIIVN